MADLERTKIRPGHHRRSGAEHRRMLAEARDLRALELYVKGWKLIDICGELGLAPYEGSASYAIKRALRRRAAYAAATVDEARALYLARLEKLVNAWMPYATGDLAVTDEDDGPARPDPRAADVVLKTLAQIAEIEHTTVRPVQPVSGPTVTVNNLVYSELTAGRELQDRILDSLDAMRRKMAVVDGTFAEVGTTLAGASGVPDDRDAPPVLALPRAPEDAA